MAVPRNPRYTVRVSAAPFYQGRFGKAEADDAFGHDHLWWLDRIVRTTTSLVERMVPIRHDWFATSNSGAAGLARPVLLR
jgi:hypothetical protein